MDSLTFYIKSFAIADGGRTEFSTQEMPDIITDEPQLYLNTIYHLPCLYTATIGSGSSKVFNSLMSAKQHLSVLQLQQSLGQVFVTLQIMVLSCQNCLYSVSGISIYPASFLGLIPRLLCRGGEVHTVGACTNISIVLTVK